MPLLVRAARVLLFLLDRPRTVGSVAVAIVAVGIGRARSAAVDAASVVPIAEEPAFCNNLDRTDVYLWGEVGAEGPNAVRAFASVKDPTSYCTVRTRATFAPRLRRADGRLAYLEWLDNGGGERAQLFVGGGMPVDVATPHCVTRFRWFEFDGTRPHYGCEVRDPYDKEWYPVFYRDDGVLIGARRGLTSAVGDPSAETILAYANEGLSIVDTRDATVIVEVTGLSGEPKRARAAPEGFILAAASGDERRLWQIDRAGRATLVGSYAALPSTGTQATLALATDGALYEYVPDVHGPDGRTNEVVVRTLKESRVIYSDAKLKEQGRPYVRLDTKTQFGAGVFTAR
jgi:hypothetical protein